MNDPIIYRPYQVYRWFVPPMVFMEIFYFVMLGYSMAAGMGFWVSILFALGGIISVYLVKSLYDSSNVLIRLEQDGLRIAGGRYKSYRFLPVETLSCAYYARNVKGHLFVVLSPKELTPKEVKYAVRRAEKLLIDNAVVLPIVSSQDVSPVKKWISDHVPRIEAIASMLWDGNIN